MYLTSIPPTSPSSVLSATLLRLSVVDLVSSPSGETKNREPVYRRPTHVKDLTTVERNVVLEIVREVPPSFRDYV